jgi:hypothetical protein
MADGRVVAATVPAQGAYLRGEITAHFARKGNTILPKHPDFLARLWQFLFLGETGWFTGTHTGTSCWYQITSQWECPPETPPEPPPGDPT